MIKIREANENDNDNLIELERKCPMGTSLVLSHDSSPDYFVRSKPFKDWHVLVATEDKKIVGSAGVSIRKSYVGRRLCKTAYEYGFLVDPQHRRKGIATQLQECVEHIALQKNVDLLYLNVIEENVPSINLFSKMGFKLLKNYAVFSFPVYKRQMLGGDVIVRCAENTDVEKVVGMINYMYRDYDFFFPFQNEDFIEYVERMPYFDLRNILIIKGNAKIKACLGYWDYNKVMKFIVQKFNWRMRILSFMAEFMSLFTKMPVVPKPGETLMMYYLTTLAYEDSESVVELFKYLINKALANSVSFLSIPLDLESPIATVLSKFTHSKVKLHFFVKSLKSKVVPRVGATKLYIDVIDM